MGDRFKVLSQAHMDFISEQGLFFVATADVDGFVNVSPKGMDTFRVLDETKVAWLNLTGSGNETAGHVRKSGRMTIMFCSFGKSPTILRLYGKASTLHARNDRWNDLIDLFPEHMGARQIFEVDLELVQTSCGYGVPYYELKGERPTLTKWTENKGREGVEEYWRQKNVTSLNEKPTGIFDEPGE